MRKRGVCVSLAERQGTCPGIECACSVEISTGSALNHTEDDASPQTSLDNFTSLPFLKLASLSFEIPPPISVSVRSRQAGTETEREPSAMEALGPGKQSDESPRGVWSSSVQRLGVGRGL